MPGSLSPSLPRAAPPRRRRQPDRPPHSPPHRSAPPRRSSLASVATGAQDGGHEVPAAPGEPSQVSASSVWGWVKSAARRVKKHIGFSDGTPVVKGTHDIGGGGK